MDSKSILDEVLSQLEEIKNEERQKWARGYFPTQMEILGATAADIKPITKDLRQRYRDARPNEIIDLAKVFSGSNIHELQTIGFEVLGRFKESLKLLSIDDLKEIGRNLDNWASVDAFGILITGQMWRMGVITDSTIEEWAKSDNKWKRRLALVSTVPLNQKSRGGNGDPERTINICSMLAGEREDMVVKALSWALRELAKRKTLPVVNFLADNKEKLHSRVVREVTRKIETGKKNL
jgi:3-methyladenine DNA glycosylase AlkD